VVDRGGRPSPEMLQEGSGILPRRDSDSGAPPWRESISDDFACFGQRSSFLRQRWRRRRRRLYLGARRGAAGAGSSGSRGARGEEVSGPGCEIC
jgi:hypothetical protein